MAPGISRLPPPPRRPLDGNGILSGERGPRQTATRPANGVVYVGCAPGDRGDVERALVQARVSVIWAENPGDVPDERRRRDMPLILDLSRDGTALRHVRELRPSGSSTPAMFAIIGPRRPELATEAVLAGMADLFTWPVDGRHVANAIARERTYAEASHGTPRPGRPDADLYSHSHVMRSVMALVTQAALTRAGVVIAGEAGTGRQVAARAIHALQTPEAPFASLDCASRGPLELEQELFGLPGAPRNGDSRELETIARRSLLHDLKGGTLYLQRVAETAGRLQGRLARVLRDREAVLADTGQIVALDIRPIASLDREIEELVREGRLRDDLRCRFSATRIQMPPLRSRREDIPALANYLIRTICAEQGRPPQAISRAALSLLTALPWRNNVTELRTLLANVIGTVKPERPIGIDGLLAHVRLDGGSAPVLRDGTLSQAKARFERDYIEAVLEHHRGRVSEAAKALGIQRTNLYRKIRSLRGVPLRHD
jgi:DNA-binding NtrC family response regulator